MKCIHCSARVDRNAWFCSNCKRSVSARRSHGTVRYRVSAAVAALAVMGAVVTLSSRWMTGPGAPVAEVSVRELPLVQITARAARAERRAEPAVAPVEPEPRLASPEPEPERVSAPAVEQVAAVPPPAQRGVGFGAISVAIDQPVRTFVYLNGGTLLGEAPLRNATVPAGEHTLVFWSPEVGGRSTRSVNIAPGESLELTERVRARESFRGEAGG